MHNEEKLTEEDIGRKVIEDASEYLGEMDADKDGSLTEAEVIKHYGEDMKETEGDMDAAEDGSPPEEEEGESVENMAVGDDPDAPIESEHE